MPTASRRHIRTTDMLVIDNVFGFLVVRSSEGYPNALLTYKVRSIVICLFK